MAIKHHLIVIVSLALIQNETGLAQKYIRELMELDPAVLGGNPCEFVDFMLNESIADESVDHKELLNRMSNQLPQELNWLAPQFDWAVGRGWLWKGIRAVIWDRLTDARRHFSRAVELHAGIDENLIQLITYHLLGHEKEFGTDAVLKVLSNLSPFLNRVTKSGSVRLEGSYLVNRAFENYRNGKYKKVPALILRACKDDPSYIRNRGVLSIFLRSVSRIVLQ